MRYTSVANAPATAALHGQTPCALRRWLARHRATALAAACCCATALAAGPTLVRRLGSGVATPRSSSGLENLEAKSEQHSAVREPHSRWNGQCPGDIELEGYGTISLVNSKWSVPGVRASPVFAKNNDTVVAHMDSRTYFAQKGQCNESGYNNTDYVNLKMLGKGLRYTVDLSGIGCGCNAALSLVPMRHNSNATKCEDYYCDSMQVCGVACAEIDVQEANMFAWLSTMHLRDDAAGVSGGYGGDYGKPDIRHWTKVEYGPNGSCINTSKPFDVEVSFPTDSSGRLRDMDVTLSQEGSPCEVYASNDLYMPRSGRDAFVELTRELDRGLTPVISYWSSPFMGWLDGPGRDKNGPCSQGADDPEKCKASVRFFDFQFGELARSVSVHLNKL